MMLQGNYIGRFYIAFEVGQISSVVSNHLNEGLWNRLDKLENRFLEALNENESLKVGNEQLKEELVEVSKLQDPCPPRPSEIEFLKFEIERLKNELIVTKSKDQNPPGDSESEFLEFTNKNKNLKMENERPKDQNHPGVSESEFLKIVNENEQLKVQMIEFSKESR